MLKLMFPSIPSLLSPQAAHNLTPALNKKSLKLHNCPTFENYTLKS